MEDDEGRENKRKAKQEGRKRGGVKVLLNNGSPSSKTHSCLAFISFTHGETLVGVRTRMFV